VQQGGLSHAADPVLPSQGAAPCNVPVGLSIQPSLPTYLSRVCCCSRSAEDGLTLVLSQRCRHQEKRVSCHERVSHTEAFLGSLLWVTEEEEGLQDVFKRLRRNGLGDSLFSAERLAVFFCFLGVCRDVVACAHHNNSNQSLQAVPYGIGTAPHPLGRRKVD
jgi:hypothetical protein